MAPYKPDKPKVYTHTFIPQAEFIFCVDHGFDGESHTISWQILYEDLRKKTEQKRLKPSHTPNKQ